jgi:hypothetical protein
VTVVSALEAAQLVVEASLRYIAAKAEHASGQTIGGIRCRTLDM